jgi:hypothetical protein
MSNEKKLRVRKKWEKKQIFGLNSFKNKDFVKIFKTDNDSNYVTKLVESKYPVKGLSCFSRLYENNTFCYLLLLKRYFDPTKK